MRRAPALSFLLVTVFIDMLGLGLIVPIVPALLTAVTEDATDAVRWSGLLGSTYGLLQFVVSPLLGRLSDRYGRHGALTGIGAIAETVVPLAAGLAFGWSLTYASPGSVFVVAAAFAAASTFLMATTPAFIDSTNAQRRAGGGT